MGEEQRARQQAEGGGEETAPAPAAAGGVGEDESSEEALLQRALAMSMDTGEAGGAAPKERDLSSMTEEEQIAYAMQMSMEVAEKDDYSEVMNDPAFLQSVLQNLPGVDPQSEAVRNAMGAIKDEKKEDKKDEKKEDKK